MSDASKRSISNPSTLKPQLLLASSSRYRRELLSRLGLPFLHLSPDIDESSVPGELPERLAERLAMGKAQRAIDMLMRNEGGVNRRHLAEQAWVIASDQVASLNGSLLGKPGTVPNAINQLRQCSGNQVCFYTSVCLISVPRAGENRGELIGVHVSKTTVEFKQLSAAQIERYIALEKPLDCTGSFKVEGLGVALFESVQSSDPTDLVGLPLIPLITLLKSVGVDPLANL